MSLNNLTTKISRLLVASLAVLLIPITAQAQCFETDPNVCASTGNSPIISGPYQSLAFGDVLGSFAAPAGVNNVGLDRNPTAASDLLMTQTTNDVVSLVSATGTVGSSFPVTNNSNPLGITSNFANIFLTDSDNDDVDMYTNAGAYVSSFFVASTFPEGIAFNPATGNLYVVNGTNGANTVLEYTVAGVLVNTFPILGSSPDGIAWDPTRGTYWIYDSGTDMVRHYGCDFVELENFPGTNTAGFGIGEGVAIIGDELFVMASNSTVVRFDLTGAMAPPSCPILPVELVSFTGQVQGKDVVLSWETATESENAGFEVQHRQENTTLWVDRDFVAGNGTSLESKQYQYQVSDLDPGTHYFRLKQIDFDGAFEYSPEIEMQIDLPGEYVLGSAYPNPFNPSTSFQLSVSVEQSVQITLHDAMGKAVREVFDGVISANKAHVFTINASGLPSGLYHYRVIGQNFDDARPVTLMK